MPKEMLELSVCDSGLSHISALLPNLSGARMDSSADHVHQRKVAVLIFLATAGGTQPPQTMALEFCRSEWSRGPI